MLLPLRRRACQSRHLALWTFSLAATVLSLLLPVSRLAAQTGTFIDRWAATDLRVVTYNIYQDSIFPDDPDYGLTQPVKFARVMQALQPDIINLQEIYDHPNVSQSIDLINSILPLEGGASWYGYKAFDNVTLSKYPLSMQFPFTIPAAVSTNTAIELVDLPDDQYATDFYLMNNHFKCCGGVGTDEDIRRQTSADALVNWMRDARTPGGYVDLPEGTPMAVVGDLNLVGSLQPLTTLITGDIIYENIFGVDSAPDWDGTDLTDAHPLQHGTGDDYTYRVGCCNLNRLDYVLYTDSTADVANTFVLNTATMSGAELSATGLQSLDIALNSNYYDHLPVVIDFRLAAPPEEIPGDYDGSGYVDEDDFTYWRAQFGMAFDPGTESDGNGDGVINAADYTFWRDHLGAGTPPGSGAAAAAVPEPTSISLWIVLGAFLVLRLRAD